MTASTVVWRARKPDEVEDLGLWPEERTPSRGVSRTDCILPTPRSTSAKVTAPAGPGVATPRGSRTAPAADPTTLADSLLGTRLVRRRRSTCHVAAVRR